MKRLLLTLILCVVAFPLAFAGPTETFYEILKEEWAFRIKENPFFASQQGVAGADHLLPSQSVNDIERRHEYYRQVLGRLDKIKVDALAEKDKINYDLFKYEINERIREFQYKAYLVPISASGGFHANFARVAGMGNFKTPQDFENYSKRLTAYPAYVDQHIALMKEGMKSGITLPKAVLNGFDGTITSLITDKPEESLFYGPFKNLPTHFTAAEKKLIQENGRKAVQKVSDGNKVFLNFMQQEYMPRARTSIGAASIPNGTAYYNQLVSHFTTMDMTPEQVHQIGLKEVARIRAEMESVIKETNFKGSFPEFLQFLRTDPQFYPKTAEELLKEAAFIAKKMDGKLPSLFGKLPRQPYGVEPVPANLAPRYTGGRYSGAPLDGLRAGNYWVNTYKLDSRPLYVLESLTLHEAVPGHHLQIALSKEITDVPAFRKDYYISAFGEGWGLYSEWLGLETGFYQNPYSNFGRLTYEMWRACRLVVDTGLHAKGWTREQAIEYLASNSALSMHEVTTEIDRYISDPGQALSYKIGELKIKELRAKAEKALGEKFDVREFHDKVLENGSITLPMLEKVIDAYIASKGV